MRPHCPPLVCSREFVSYLPDIYVTYKSVSPNVKRPSQCGTSPPNVELPTQSCGLRDLHEFDSICARRANATPFGNQLPSERAEGGPISEWCPFQTTRVQPAKSSLWFLQSGHGLAEKQSLNCFLNRASRVWLLLHNFKFEAIGIGCLEDCHQKMSCQESRPFWNFKFEAIGIGCLEGCHQKMRCQESQAF